MNEHIYYHFWCLENAEIPYGKDIISDGENIYYHSRKSNDHEFFRLYRYLKTSSATKDYEQFTFELLNIYLNINYNEMNKNCIHDNALIWIHHTIDILSEFKEDYKFLTEKAGKFLSDFTPNEKIHVKTQENGVIRNRFLNRNDKFFANLVTVNININGILSESININPIANTNNNEVETEESINLRIKVYLMIEILKKIGVTCNEKKVKDINELISIITGNSKNTIKKYVNENALTTKTHGTHINKIK